LLDSLLQELSDSELQATVMNYNFDFLGGLQNNHGSSFYSGFGLNSQHPPLSTFKDDIFKEDFYISDEEENGSGGRMPRLPLFGRCPLTNKAYLDTGFQNAVSKVPTNQNLTIRSQENDGVLVSKQSRVMGDISNVTNRIPLLQISNQLSNEMSNKPSSPKKISWSQIAKKPALEPQPTFPVSSNPITPPNGRSAPTVVTNLPTFEDASKPSPTNSAKKALNPVKPSLDDVKDDSIVALTNKHGKGKYWFKSGCPTPDPRWSSKQQLMIGPIPGDVEYATLRSAFLSKGHTIHLFIQNNQAWLEKNQEKFGKKQVKFGYVVYTEPEVARRLLSCGHVMVGHAKVAVKEMDGQPAIFNN